MIKSRWPVHEEEELDAVRKVLVSGKTNYWTGTECRKFEEEFAEFFGCKHAVALMNGTVALEAALHGLDVGRGDEVITASRTFIASASAIVMRGATPVIAEVDAESQNITADTIAACLSPKTKAVIVVHLAGWPADMDAILALAAKKGFRVIEDCAQAHGAALSGRRVGSMGDVGAFSFCQDKIITTGGEGGMITTSDREIWKKIWEFRDHGKNQEKTLQPASPGFRWLHDSFGTNWRMTEMQAAIGRIQLGKLSDWLNIRNKNAKILQDKWRDVSGLRVPVPPANICHAYYKYYVFVHPEILRSEWSRDRIMAEMLERNIPCFTGSCSEIYLEKAFQERDLQPKSRWPIAKQLGETSLMFQVDPSVPEETLHKIANALQEIMAQATP